MHHEATIQNWELFKTQAMKAAQVKKNIPELLELLEADEGQVILCPASTRKDYIGCYPGGLVEHSLRVLSCMSKLRTVYGATNDATDTELITVGLFHDIGKVGRPKPKPEKFHKQQWDSYYTENTSSWHREKLGMLYEVNKDLSFICPQQLSLMLLAEHEVDLNLREWHAIASLQPERDLNNAVAYPKDHEPFLAVLLRHAITAVSRDTKGKHEASYMGRR